MRCRKKAEKLDMGFKIAEWDAKKRRHGNSEK